MRKEIKKGDAVLLKKEIRVHVGPRPGPFATMVFLEGTSGEVLSNYGKIMGLKGSCRVRLEPFGTGTTLCFEVEVPPEDLVRTEVARAEREEHRYDNEGRP